jgi:hypothetical protein
MDEIMAKVKEIHQIDLVPEVRILGKK